MNPDQTVLVWLAGFALVLVYAAVRYHYRLGAGQPVNGIDDGLLYVIVGMLWPLGALCLIGYTLLYPVRALGRRRARLAARPEQFYPGARE